MRASCSNGRRRGGFTLMELLVSLSIIAVLASLTYPAVIQGSKQFQLIRCMGQMRKVGRATAQYLTESAGNSAATQPVSAWMNALEPYGTRDDYWICPARRHEGKSKRGDSDFMYAGATPDIFRSGERMGDLYLWVEVMPNHNGLHVCAMGDGRVVAENLLKMEF